MRRIIVSMGTCLVMGLIACATVVAPPAQAATLSWRFIGLEGLKGKTNLVVFRDVTGLKEFNGFRSNLTDRVARTLATHATKGGTNEDLVKLLRPMAEDIVSYESLFERGEEGANVCALAVKLPAARHDIWKKNWDAILKDVKIEGASLSREGDWTFVTNGKSKKLLDRAKSAASDVFEFQGDADTLGNMWPGLGGGRADLKVQPQGSALRTVGKLKFEKDLNLKLTSWDIPTNTVREPLIGFTAMQGMSDFLSKQPGFKKHPAPNQLFIWNEELTLFSISAAAKVDDPKTFVRDFATDLIASPLSKQMVGELEVDTNLNSVNLMHLPIAIPFLKPAHSNDVNFVYAGFWPAVNFSKDPMPAGLAAQLTSATNLVYYDWEASGMRSQQWRPIFQTISFMLRQPTPSYEGPAHTWLKEAEGKLRQSITDVRQTGARELSITRVSDLGLSSLELFELAQWVTGPPPASASLSAPAPATPAAPVAPKKR